ncbi:MAG: 30S ribosomal protein S2 [Chloroflexi bacterium RBG_16_51_16]|nr:MAG: 30S ribosomal protein S2 [Chloroflexi bacterium RBG_16_51_16]
MSAISMKALLESGVHFGHRTNKWDPRMKPYIFTERNGIHIIDLQQTVKYLNQAFTVIRDLVAGGGILLFVGTKRQAQETIAEEANRCGMPYVTERWMGGMLTNWATIYKRIQELERLEKLRDNKELEHLTKKEGLLIEREILRLQTRLSGARTLKRRPDMLFVVDVCREEAAVHEANILQIPIVALVDTNCNPQEIDYVIPSNDDAIRAIKLLVAKVSDAVLEGKTMRKEEDLDQQPSTEAEPAYTPKPTRAVAAGVEPDEEMVEEVLLGEATLAKLNVSRKVVTEPEPVVQEAPKEILAEDENKVDEKAVTKAKAQGRKVKEEITQATVEPSGEPESKPTNDEPGPG